MQAFSQCTLNFILVNHMHAPKNIQLHSCCINNVTPEKKNASSQEEDRPKFPVHMYMHKLYQHPGPYLGGGQGGGGGRPP